MIDHGQILDMNVTIDYHCQMLELYRILCFIFMLNHDPQSTAINGHELIRLGSMSGPFIIIALILLTPQDSRRSKMPRRRSDDDELPLEPYQKRLPPYGSEDMDLYRYMII